MTTRSGRHFLQVPGPSPVPDEVVRAMAAPVLDHRGPEFREFVVDLLPRLGPVFGTAGPVAVYPSSGTGAWEAAMVNTLSPGDRVLGCETGQFAVLWAQLAERLGFVPELLPGDWRHGADAAAVGERLARDRAGEIKAVMVVHNETSTGVTSRVRAVGDAIRQAGHGALLFVDAVSSVGSMPVRHDEWGVDVTIAGSQKGLMLPPGLGFNVVSEKALAAASGTGPRPGYWAWGPMLSAGTDGLFPFTPATSLLFGLRAALGLLESEGLENVFRRHDRHGRAVRAAVAGWGLEVQAQDEEEQSNVVTAVMLPDGVDADKVRALILDRFDMSLGTGLGRLAGKVFRIGHLGSTNDLTIAGALAGVQMGLQLAGLPAPGTGLEAALAVLANP
ncbi:MAG TPA: aminotransferase class V-fold PLP-dependent enzyme [Trebonia sp.]|nr:aminotransferase class V-fold PLP-dependent enzyme [Trebonia sp.]